MAVRMVIQAGNRLLKKKNKQIINFKSPKIRRLQKDLMDTIYKANLIGIAAPQIGENYMIFITHPRNTKARKLGRTDKLRIFINPKIKFKFQEESVIYEGCGSIVKGDFFGPVLRPKEIEIEAIDENGQKFILRCDGILARVIQHEYDHLMGIEFLEKITNYRKVVVGKYYKEKIRNSKPQKQNSLITKIDYKKL